MSTLSEPTATTKYLFVRFSDGVAWEIPAQFIAEARARYYAERDTGETEGEEFYAVFTYEVDYALRNRSEIEDWAFNSMNWEDVKDVAVLVGADPRVVDYHDEWTNVDHDIVEGSSVPRGQA